MTYSIDKLDNVRNVKRINSTAQTVAAAEANSRADMNVWLAEYNEREKQDITIDATKPRCLVAEARCMPATFTQNLLYW